MTHPTDNLRIVETKEVLAPEALREQLPMTDRAAGTVHFTRQAIHKLLHGEDDRLLVIAGPCSIHDLKSAEEYGRLLLPLREQLHEDLEIVMRVYFEKPRTRVGWKGLINDPHLDGSFAINDGVWLARRLLLNLSDQGMPAATEYLDLISPQYISDLVAWGAIGARTTESQGHRELASGLSCPVGFKNGTDGNLKIAVDAIAAAGQSHVFMSVTPTGRSAIFRTAGNADCHLILRGGKTPNYDEISVQHAMGLLREAEVNRRVMIDFSHANSRKRHERQPVVGNHVAEQIAAGNEYIMGAMIESHLVAGRQKLVAGQPLAYGQSITDACIDFETTVPLLLELAAAVRRRRQLRAA